jgi:hypothetical protein
MLKSAILLALVCSSTASVVISDDESSLGNSTLVGADDSHITYTGRFDTKDPKNPVFSWSATQIELTFNGSAILKAGFTSPGPGMRLLACVDGVFGKPFVIGASMNDDDDDGNHKDLHTIVTVASGLDISKTHTVVVWKLNEDTAGSDGKKGQRGSAVFHGFHVDSSAKLHPPTPRLSRRIEFIGDSDTAGWCCDGEFSKGYDTAHKYENAHDTWAGQLAYALKADMMVEAISGWGVGAGAEAIQQNLPNSVNFDSASTPWDYTKWVPNAVIMLIGPNDEMDKGIGIDSKNFTRKVNAGYESKKFITQYLKLLDYVAAAYAKASTKPQIISVCGGSLNGLDPCGDIQVNETNVGRKE